MKQISGDLASNPYHPYPPLKMTSNLVQKGCGGRLSKKKGG